MRQVPTYLIIGNGRMASHFCHYLKLLSLPFLQWARKTHSIADLQLSLNKATHIVVLISDSSIPTFINNLTLSEKKIIIHFSGMLSIPNAYSAHPLMTFSHDLYDKHGYEQIPFILEEGSPNLSTLLPGLPNQGYFIPPALKPFYHALCVMSNNFTCLLWQKINHELSHSLNLPPEIILPYITQTFKNLTYNPHGSLTGPLVRGDKVTINKHLAALESDDFLEIYQAFVNYYQNKCTTKEVAHEHF